MTRPVIHRGGFPPLDPATIGKAMRDGRAHKPLNIDEIERSLRDQTIRDRLNGPPRMVRIEPRIRWGELLVMAAVAAAIGAMLAIGGVL